MRISDWSSDVCSSDLQNEVEQSAYNFEHADVAELFHRFDACEAEALRLVELDLPLPAYEQVMKASHSFNLLDARRAISVTERQRTILRVRKLSQAVAESYLATRAKLGYPGLKPAANAARTHSHPSNDEAGEGEDLRKAHATLIAKQAGQGKS